MPGRVKILDNALVNKIKAGEVVERPANVVKELLENALDAGAASIQVELEQGGTRLIRVTDDGVGMNSEDATRALMRHATSKIARFEDLEALETLGFRGEALPSIASVSRFSLRTRTAEALAGVEIRVDDEGQPRALEVGCAKGTSVEVRDLFFNVPVRRKFLKSTTTESAHIGDICRRTALSAPELRLTLMRDGKRGATYLPTSDFRTRTLEVLSITGPQVVEAEVDGVSLVAVLSPPEHCRSGTNGLHVFVNGRPVRDRRLARAVAFAYGSVLPPGKYPIGAVQLRVASSDVDVNVHPQKSEVRFHSSAVYDSVTQMIAHSMGTRAWSGPGKSRTVRAKDDAQDYWNAKLGLQQAPWEPRNLPLSGSPVAGNASSVSEPADPWDLSGQKAQGSALSEASMFAAKSGGTHEFHDSGRTPPSGAMDYAHSRATRADSAVRDASRGPAGPVAPSQSMLSSLPTLWSPSASLGSSDAQNLPNSQGPSTSLGLPLERGSILRVLGQVRKMFLVCEERDGICILDQHAADERIRFDELKRSYLERRVAMQRLLFPERTELSEDEAAFVEEHANALLELGLEADRIGPCTVSVHAIPVLVRNAPPDRVLRDAVSELMRTGDRAFGDAADMILATMACHGSIRGGDTLSLPECEALVRKLAEVEDFGTHCPHGRPVVFRVGFKEIERRLGR